MRSLGSRRVEREGNVAKARAQSSWKLKEQRKGSTRVRNAGILREREDTETYPLFKSSCSSEGSSSQVKTPELREALTEGKEEVGSDGGVGKGKGEGVEDGGVGDDGKRVRGS